MILCQETVLYKRKMNSLKGQCSQVFLSVFFLAITLHPLHFLRNSLSSKPSRGVDLLKASSILSMIYLISEVQAERGY